MRRFTRILLPLHLALLTIREGAYRSGNSLGWEEIIYLNVLLFLASNLVSSLIRAVDPSGTLQGSLVRVLYISSFFAMSIINYRSIRDARAMAPLLVLPIDTKNKVIAIIIAHFLWGGIALSPLLISPVFAFGDTFMANFMFPFLAWLNDTFLVIGTVLWLAYLEVSSRKIPLVVVLSWIIAIMAFQSNLICYPSPSDLLTVPFTVGYFLSSALAFGRAVGTLHERSSFLSSEILEFSHLTPIRKEFLLIRRRPWLLPIMIFSVFPHPIFPTYLERVQGGLMDLTLISFLELAVVMPLFIIWLYSAEGTSSRTLYILPLTRFKIFWAKYSIYMIVCLAIDVPIILLSLITGGGLTWYLMGFLLTLASFSSLYSLMICRLLPERESSWTFYSLGWLKLISIMVIAEAVFITVFLGSLNGPVVDVDSMYLAFSWVDAILLLSSLFLSRYLCDRPL